MKSDTRGIVGLPVKLAVCFLVLGLMVPLVTDIVRDADEEMSLHELRGEAMDLRDSVQRAYFQQAVVTHELRIPSGQSLVVGGGDGYGYLIRLCVDGQQVENLTLGSSVVLGEETVLSGHMVLKLSGCMDEDGDYGVVVT